MRNVCLFLKCKNLCFGIQWTLGKHFFPPADCGSIFPAKSCQDVWRSGSWLARGQVNMVDEAKLHSPVHSTFEALVVWCAVSIVLEKNWTHSVYQCWLYHCGFWCFSSFCWAYISDVVVLLGFRNLWWVRLGADRQTSDRDLILVQVWLWKVLWSFSVYPLSWSLPVV